MEIYVSYNGDTYWLRAWYELLRIIGETIIQIYLVTASHTRDELAHAKKKSRK